MPASNLLEIILRLRDEASAGLDKFSKRAKDIGRDISGIGRQMTLVGGMITGAVGTMVYAASNAEKSWAKVSREIELAGLDIGKTLPTIKSFAAEMQNLTGMSDELVGEFVGRMLPVTKNVGAAFDATRLAMDMAVGTGRDFESMQRVMTLVFSGNIEALRMYVPEIKGLDSEQLKTMSSSQKVAFAMEAVRKQFGGLAEQEGKTAAGQMKILRATVVDLWEDLGGMLLPVIQEVVASITEKIKAVRQWVANNKELVEVIMKTVAGLGVFLTTMGGTLFIIGKFIGLIPTMITGLKGIGSMFSFAFGHPIVLAIMAVVAAIGYTIVKLNEFGKEVGGIGNAWALTLLYMNEKVIEWGIKALETFDAVAKYIPGLGWAVGKGLDYLRNALKETGGDFNALATAQKDNKEKSEDLTSTIEKLKKEMGKVGDITKDTEEKFKDQVRTVKELRDEIKDLYKQLENNAKDYSKREADIRADYQEQIVEKVADAENEINELRNKLARATEEGNWKEIRELEDQINKKQTMIAEFHSRYKDLEDDLAERKRYLAMNELEQLEFNMNKKIQMAQIEFLNKQIELTKELIFKTQMHNEAIKMIGEEKKEAIEAEIEKSKTFKQKLEEKIQGLKGWVSQSIEMYREYVSSVNALLSQIRAPVPVGGTYYGSYQFGTAYVPRTGTYLLHKGEAVIPAGRRVAGGGVSVNIYGGTYLSEEAAEEIGDLIIKKLKRNLRI